MWLSITPGRLSKLPGPQQTGIVLEGELNPDTKPCPLLSLDAGTSQHLQCKTYKRQGDAHITSERFHSDFMLQYEKASAPKVKEIPLVWFLFLNKT